MATVGPGRTQSSGRRDADQMGILRTPSWEKASAEGCRPSRTGRVPGALLAIAQPRAFPWPLAATVAAGPELGALKASGQRTGLEAWGPGPRGLERGPEPQLSPSPQLGAPLTSWATTWVQPLPEGQSQVRALAFLAGGGPGARLWLFRKEWYLVLPACGPSRPLLCSPWL